LFGLAALAGCGESNKTNVSNAGSDSTSRQGGNGDEDRQWVGHDGLLMSIMPADGWEGPIDVRGICWLYMPKKTGEDGGEGATRAVVGLFDVHYRDDITTVNELMEEMQDGELRDAKQFGEITSTTVNGMDALECVFTTEKEDTGRIICMFKKDSYAFAILCYAPTKDYDAFSGDFQRMIDSFLWKVAPEE